MSRNRIEVYEVNEKGEPLGKAVVSEEEVTKQPNRFRKELPAASLNRLKGWQQAGK